MKSCNIILLCLLLMGISSCSRKSSTNTDNRDSLLAYDETMRGGVIEMNRFVIKDTVRYGMHLYEYKIVREADSTLAKVQDQESKNIYMDNHILLTIKKDSMDFFRKTFVKRDFQEYLDNNFLQNGILEGFVFDSPVGEGLRFATSVSYPQSDMYIPLLVTIDFNGGISIKKDNYMENEMGDSAD